MTVDSLIDPGCSLRELVAGRPRPGSAIRATAARLLLRRAPYPRWACAKRGLDLDEVLAAIQALEERGLRSTRQPVSV